MKRLLTEFADELVKNRWVQLLTIVFTIGPGLISFFQGQLIWAISLISFGLGFIGAVIFARRRFESVPFNKDKASQAFANILTNIPPNMPPTPATLLSIKGGEVVFVIGGADRDYTEIGISKEAKDILNSFYGTGKHTFASMTDCLAMARLVEALCRACGNLSFDYRLALDVIADEKFKAAHNFITIGAGDSNPFTCQVQQQFEKRFGTKLPIYFEPYSTSHDLVVAYKPGCKYNEKVKAYHNYGLLALVPNPYEEKAPEKVIIIAAGLHREGTQAAINYLIQNVNKPIKNEELLDFPVVIVKPEEAVEHAQ